MGFCHTGEKSCEIGDTPKYHFGIDYILMQSAPCALVKLIHFFGNDPTSKQTTINVTFHDARKKLPGKMLELAYFETRK